MLIRAKQAAINEASRLAGLTGVNRFVVCLAGEYYVTTTHKPGRLAGWYAEVSPNGTISEGF